MNPIIEQMISSYIGAFDSYKISSPSLQTQVDAFKQKMIRFGEENSDISTFYTKLTESGLQEEYISLFTKVTMASSGSADESGNAKTDYGEEAPTPVVSVREFLEQYRISYNEVKKAGYRKRAEAAYEEIFSVANRTDDMLEAQIILEKERLLWKIVALDALDCLEPVLEAMDPLQTATTAALQLQIDTYKRVSAEEELLSELEFKEHAKIAKIHSFSARMNMAILLADHLTKYCRAKEDIFLWKRDDKVKGALAALVSLRYALRRTLRCLQEHWGLTFDELLRDEGIKIWMLLPENVDALGRVKTILHPQNLEVFRDAVNNEILSELPLSELLARELPAVFWYDLDGFGRRRYVASAEQTAAQLDSSLTYYRYTDQLRRASSEYLEKRSR